MMRDELSERALRLPMGQACRDLQMHTLIETT